MWNVGLFGTDLVWPWPSDQARALAGVWEQEAKAVLSRLRATSLGGMFPPIDPKRSPFIDRQCCDVC